MQVVLVEASFLTTRGLSTSTTAVVAESAFLLLGSPLVYHLGMTPPRDRFRQQVKILAGMYLGYGAMMVCRQMVTILSAAIREDPSLSVTNSDIGDFLGYGTIGAATGKLVWGPLGDRIGGRATFLLGIVLSAALLIAFGLSPNVGAFIAFSFLLYGAKSAGWPGMTKLVGNWYHPKNYGRVWSIVSTSSRASVVTGTLFFGWLLSMVHWRWVAGAAAAGSLLIGVLCYFALSEQPSDPDFLTDDGPAGGGDEEDEHAAESARVLESRSSHPLIGLSLVSALVAFSRSGRCWLMAVMLMSLTVLMAVLDFLPMYLTQVHRLSVADATMASSAFPIGSLAGLIASILFYDRFSKRGLRTVLTVMLVGATACVLGLKFLPGLGLDPRSNCLAALAMIFGIGFMISPSYYVPVSVFSIEFGGPFSATLVCLFDGLSFVASATFNFVGGRLSEGDGAWGSVMTLIALVASAATLSVWGFTHAEYRAARR